MDSLESCQDSARYVWSRDCRIRSSRQFLDNKSSVNLSPRKRYHIALILASSHVQLQPSPWLKSKWSKRAILLLHDTQDSTKLSTEHAIYFPISFQILTIQTQHIHLPRRYPQPRHHTLGTLFRQGDRGPQSMSKLQCHRRNRSSCSTIWPLRSG